MTDNTTCSITGYDGCILPKYTEHGECILHCSKKEAQNDYHRSSAMLDEFKKQLIVYIADSIVKSSQEEIVHDEIYKYFGISSSIKIMEASRVRLVATKLKESTIVFNFIAFPVRDGRDNWDYEPILKKIGKIHFNYCKFYLSHLDLKESQCFFQDCEFFDNWYIQDYALLQNQSNVIYQMCTFHEGTSAAGREVQEERLSLTNSQFSDCKFGKELVLEYVDVAVPLFNNGDYFEGSVEFLKVYHCTFEKRFTFNKYSIDTVNMQSSVFSGKFEFRKNLVQEMEITNCNYKDIAAFYESSFVKFKIEQGIFEDFAGFEGSSFGQKWTEANKKLVARFEYVTFKNEVNFRNTHFNDGLDIAHANFDSEPKFLNAEIDITFTTRETFRSIKHSFDSIGNYLDANKYFALEMKKYKKELENPGSRKQEKILFWFNEKISDFGQDYWRPIRIFLYSALVYFVLYLGYEYRWLYIINPTISETATLVSKYANMFALSIMPFKKMLTEGMEFISLIFYIWYSILIWQTIVAVKRHTRR